MNQPQQEPTAADVAKTLEQLSFEQSLEHLEEIVTRLEQGQLSLSDALTSYERGMHYLKHCYRTLEVAERKIELLVRTRDDGQAECEPFEEDAMSLEEKQEARSRRRSRSSKSGAGARSSSSSRSASRSNGANPSDDVDEPGGLF